MAPNQTPLLWLIAGPNGSGKTTYYESHVRFRIKAPFINADTIAQEVFGREPNSRDEMMQAAKEAANRREALIRQRRSFVAETVFSHPSKLKLVREAKAAGYLVRLSIICTAKPELNIARVQDRVNEGGHTVPRKKIVERYHRALALLREAAQIADWALVLDNTRADQPFRLLIKFEDGQIAYRADDLPEWAQLFGS